MIMTIAVLIVFGLCLGSFANALVWRVHEQAQGRLQVTGSRFKGKRQTTTKKIGKRSVNLSIVEGRSVCTDCGHELAAKDLIPVLSWLSSGGKCRYCHKKVSVQYPIVEIATAMLFVASYVFWPYQLTAGSGQLVAFGLWLLILTGLMALLVYDLRWYLLPNRIVYPLTVLAGCMALIQVAVAPEPASAVIDTALSVLVGGGIFYALFQVSGGKWIGGGDVKLGWLLGLIIGSWAGSLLMIFIAALLGTLVSIPLMMDKKLKRNSVIPFGPFLIIGAIIVVLFGTEILDWYQQLLSVG